MMEDFITIKSINQLHRLIGYDKSTHPLISVIDYSKIAYKSEHYNINIVTDFYIVSLKSPAPEGVKYGRQYYDFDEGTMMFMAPGQVFSASEINERREFQGWGLWFHPDLIVNTTLGQRIHDFSFFSYSVTEALHLSNDEKHTLSTIIDNIQKECSDTIDNYTQKVITTAIEQLLTYSQRFYARQFTTRKKPGSDLLANFESLVQVYFNSHEIIEMGLPSVSYFAGKLNLSPGYFSDLIKNETGQTVKEYLQIRIIEFAKIKILNSNQTINEIAYSLGFEYPQYFNRLFKSKTGMTPVEYRKRI